MCALVHVVAVNWHLAQRNFLMNASAQAHTNQFSSESSIRKRCLEVMVQPPSASQTDNRGTYVVPNGGKFVRRNSSNNLFYCCRFMLLHSGSPDVDVKLWISIVCSVSDASHQQFEKWHENKQQQSTARRCDIFNFSTFGRRNGKWGE